jgi:glycosyltransferase involved in cell wall biosynthesis
MVVRKGSVPYQESLSVMQGADVLVVIDADIPGSVFLPSKLIDYIGAGRPILGITPLDSATARVIKESGGWVVPPKDTEAFARTFLAILDHYRKGTLDRFRPSPQVQEKYAIRKHAGAVAGLIETTIEHARRADGAS